MGRRILESKGLAGMEGDVKEANIGEYLQIKHGGD
jgi:hypothetical protein